MRARAAALTAGALGTLAVQAEATPLLEGPDFGDTFATRTLVPDGTDVVAGSAVLEDSGPPFYIPIPDLDYFAFDDLVPGSAFSISLGATVTDSTALFQLLDDAQNALSGFIAVPEFSAVVFAGIVPLSGELVVRAQAGQDSAGYEVVLTADRVAVPEPSAALLAGAGLAGASYLRRRRNV